MMDFTRHALGRIVEMGLTPGQVEDAVKHPDSSYPGSKNHAEGRTMYQQGDIVVCVGNSDRKVITVLWHRKEGRTS